MCACLGDELLQPRWRVACCFGRGRKNGGYCNIHKGINFNNSAKRLTDWGSDRDSSSSQRHASLTVQQATRKSSQVPQLLALEINIVAPKFIWNEKDTLYLSLIVLFSRQGKCDVMDSREDQTAVHSSRSYADNYNIHQYAHETISCALKRWIKQTSRHQRLLKVIFLKDTSC